MTRQVHSPTHTFLGLRTQHVYVCSTLLGLEAEKLSRCKGCWVPFASARKLREAVVSFYRAEKRMFHSIWVQVKVQTVLYFACWDWDEVVQGWREYRL